MVFITVVFTMLPAILQIGDSIIGNVVFILFSLLGTYFMIKGSLMCSRSDEKVDYREVLKSFDSKEFGSFLKVQLLMMLYLFLWFFFPPMSIVKSFSYAMAPYLAIENPDEGANALITKSRELMDGYKANLFVLQLSFILWIIAMVFTFGVLGLYVIPYIQVSTALFYMNRIEI